MASQHFKIATNVRLRLALRMKGYSRSQINFAIDCIDDDMIAVAMAESGASASAIGDGTLIGIIVDWFKSPEGQAFIAALLKMLLGLLMGLGTVSTSGVATTVALFPDCPEILMSFVTPASTA